MSEFVLNDETLLLGYLAHLQSKVRHMAALLFERSNHPDAGTRPEMKTSSESREMWENLSKDLVIVLGPAAALKSYGQLVETGSFRVNEIGGRDVFRITMKALKIKADKARRTHPEVKLLKSWTSRPAPKAEDEW